jgi:hypothetical protein
MPLALGQVSERVDLQLGDEPTLASLSAGLASVMTALNANTHAVNAMAQQGRQLPQLPDRTPDNPTRGHLTGLTRDTLSVRGDRGKWTRPEHGKVLENLGLTQAYLSRRWSTQASPQGLPPVQESSIKEIYAIVHSKVNAHGFLLLRSSIFCQRWDMLIMVALLFTSLVTPYEVVFGPQGTAFTMDALFWINRAMDLVFFTDMCLQVLAQLLHSSLSLALALALAFALSLSLALLLPTTTKLTASCLAVRHGVRNCGAERACVHQGQEAHLHELREIRLQPLAPAPSFATH